MPDRADKKKLKKLVALYNVTARRVRVSKVQDPDLISKLLMIKNKLNNFRKKHPKLYGDD